MAKILKRGGGVEVDVVFFVHIFEFFTRISLKYKNLYFFSELCYLNIMGSGLKISSSQVELVLTLYANLHRSIPTQPIIAG